LTDIRYRRTAPNKRALLAAAAAGAQISDGSRVLLRAIDGRAVAVLLADVRKYRFIVATYLDGKPMSVDSLGPLWAIYDANHFPEIAARPLGERFALCQ
jgi:hypothetical protein